MNNVLHRRPSGSMVVALTALAVAMSGTAIAATQMSGDALIKKHSLSGNRLRNHTITGTQVNLSKLGKVPSAVNADHATTASSATSATTAAAAVTAGSATNATNAGNANNLGGQPASAYLPASDLQSTGTVTVPTGTTGKVLVSKAPFTVTMDCTVSGGVTTATVNLGSTVTNWLSNGTVETGSGGMLETTDDSASKGNPSTTSAFINVTSPSGTQIDAQWDFGVNWPSSGECFYSGYVIE